MLAFSRYFLTLASLMVAVVNAQSAYFTQYPTQVVTGLQYFIAWDAGGASIVLDLLKGGVYQQTLFSGAGTSFTWDVDDDDDGGSDYTLRITPQGGESTPSISGTIWMIEDEDGLLVNGQLITASILDGPTSFGLSSIPATTSAATATSGIILTTSNPEPRVETVTFSSLTFTTTLIPTATNASIADETLTFVSDGLTFTTTIIAATIYRLRLSTISVLASNLPSLDTSCAVCVLLQYR